MSDLSQVNQLSDSRLKDLLSLYHSFEIPTNTIGYPDDILQHRKALEEEAKKRGLQFASQQDTYPFSSNDLRWETMQSSIDEDMESMRQPLLSPILELPGMNEDVLMMEFGTPTHLEAIDDINDIIFERIIQPPASTSGASKNTSGDQLAESGDHLTESGDQLSESGDSTSFHGDANGDDPHSVVNLKTHLKRIEDVQDLKEALSLDFTGIRIADLTLREKFNYWRVLKDLREKFRKLVPKTLTLYGELVRETTWKGDYEKTKLNLLSKEELLKHLAYVEESMTYNYRPSSRDKLTLAKKNIEDILKQRDQSISNSNPRNQPNDSDENEEDNIDDDASADDGDDTDDVSLAEVENRHKNSDQDTVSKALRRKLGKGDYQTIARTTTVTTVRKGKRPVVNRHHNSTTLPASGDDDNDDTSTSISSRRKRKSRSPKTRSRRRAVSQTAGNYKGITTFNHITDYLQFLKKLKKLQSQQ